MSVQTRTIKGLGEIALRVENLGQKGELHEREKKTNGGGSIDPSRRIGFELHTTSESRSGGGFPCKVRQDR